MASTSNRALLANYLLGQQSSAMGKNYIKNPSAFMNTIGVTASGSATVARNTTTPLTAISDFSVSLPNNATDYIEFATDTFDNSMSGKNCEVRLDYTASSIGSNVIVQVMQGSNVVASSSALSTASTARTVSVNAPCGDLSTASAIRVTNGSGNSGTSSLKVANVTYGLATNLSQSAQATLVGSAYFNPTAGCTWSRVNTALGAFPTTAACPSPTVQQNAGPGQIQTTDANLPQITVNNLPPGEYQVFATFTANYGAGSANLQYALSDGTTTTGVVSNRVTSSGNEIPEITLIGHFTYSSSGNRTFSVYGAADTSYVGIVNDSLNRRLTFTILRFPSSSELAYRPDLANVFGALKYLPNADRVASTTSATYVTMNDALFASGRVLEGVATAPSTASDLAMQVTLPAGNYEIGWYGVFEASGTNQTVCNYRLYDGTDTIGSSRINSSDVAVSRGSNSQLIGTKRFDAQTTVTFSVQAQRVAGSGVCSVYASSSTAGIVSQFTIKRLDQPMPAPLLVGSVTSNSAGLERVERVRVTTPCTSSPCTISSQSGSWVSSITRFTTGQYRLDIASGIFSSAPVCVGSAGDGAANSANVIIEPSTTSGAISSTQYSFFTINRGTGALFDSNFQFICMGPR